MALPNTKEIVLARILKTDTCWLWPSSLDKYGYGRLRYQGRGWLAHRLVYTLLIGAIPDGLTLDHLCKRPSCVRPEHLEPVTSGVNCMRGTGTGPMNKAKTHCKAGHAFDPDNTYKYVDTKGKVYRKCRLCRAATSSEFQKTSKPWLKKKRHRN